jgi:hypothetical protein
MLETERLNDLFTLLDEMTQSKISDPKFAPPLIMQRLEKYSRNGFLFTALVFFVLAAWGLLYGTQRTGFHDALLAVYLIFLVLAFVSLTAVTASSLHFLWHHRKQPFSPMLTALKNDLHRDEKFITQLWTFDKATLAYGLLQYRHRWLSFEGRVAGLAGNLRKLGLFPAWAAISMSAITLFKEDSNLLLSVPLTVAAIFSLVALGALVSLERPQQVIQLLEYAIQHADQYNTTPSDANHPCKNEMLEESALNTRKV